MNREAHALHAIALMGITAFMLACEGSKDPVEPLPRLTSLTVAVRRDSLVVGDTMAASVTGHDANGAAMSVTGAVWTSSAPAVASVSGPGLVTALSAGEAQITATAQGLSASKTIRVRAQTQTMVIAQEFHVWWRTPPQVSGQPPAGTAASDPWSHWSYSGLAMPDTLVAESHWQRDIISRGYPLIGPFDSRQADVMRWQIQLAKHAGIGGLLVDLFFASDGRFDPEHLAAFDRALDLAAAAGMKIAVLDEAAFEPAAQPIAVMTQRAIAFLTTRRNHPAYLKFDGKPVYHFNFFGKLGGWTYDQLAQFFADVEAAVGPVYWWVQLGVADEPLALTRLEVLQDTPIVPTTDGTFDLAQYRTLITNNSARVKGRGKRYAVNIFPGFDETRLGRPTKRTLPRASGATLRDQLRVARETGIDVVVVSSWNDWQENTALMPGWHAGEFTADPYRDLKSVADFTGNVFAAPQLPPSAAVDPLMHAQLYGQDRSGPIVSALAFTNDSTVSADVIDDISTVAAAEIVLDGVHSARLRSADVVDSLVPIYAGDGMTSVVSRGGREARSTAGPSSHYFYFNATAVQPGARQVQVAVEFFDEGTGALRVEYASSGNAYAMSERLPLTNTGTWKVYVFHLDGANFSGAQNFGADFRVARVGGAAALIVARVGLLMEDPGLAAVAADGAMNARNERVQAKIRRPTDLAGHLLFARGRDSAGNWTFRWKVTSVP